MKPHPLHIGIVCYPSIGGSGILASELGNELAQLGHHIHFISYELPFRVQLEHPNVYFHKVNINEYELFKYPDYSLPLAVKMLHVHQRYPLDVLHVHYAVPHAMSAVMARDMIPKGSKIPCVITTLHGTDTTLIGTDPNYQPIIKWAIEHSCGVTTVSKSLKKDTQRIFETDKKIQVIHNFFKPKLVSRSRADIRTELGVSADAILITHLSNLRPVKRIEDLLTAFSQMKQRDNAKLLLLSGGNFEPYQVLVDQLGIGKDLIVKERVFDIENYLNASDIGFYTSEYESFGLAMLEAMHYGNAVVATRTGGIPEVIEENISGLLCDVGDTSAMALALDSLVVDTDFRQLLGNAAQAQAVERFDALRQVKAYETYYREVMGSK